MNLTIAHLHDHPAHFPLIASWIHHEWWSDKPGHSVATMEARLREAADPNEIPLSLVAFLDGQPVGTVNLVDNDDEKRAHLHPWLAALLVAPQHRGRGIGSELVRSLLAEAARLGVSELYLGTDAPGFYARLGAEVHEQITDEFCIMRARTGV